MSSRALFRTGVAPLAVLGLVKVTGPEAAAFLQAQLTNDVNGLAPGETPRHAPVLSGPYLMSKFKSTVGKAA